MKLKLIIITIITLLSVLVPASIQAQGAQKNLFIATEYQNRQELDFLFVTSVHPVDTIQSPSLKTPFFISIVTPQQKAAIEKAGYTPKVIDDDAGELTRYYLFESELGGAFPSNTGFEIVYPFTDVITLVKLPQGADMEELRSEPLIRMHMMQYAFDLVLPKITQAAGSVTPSLMPSLKETPKENKGIIMLIVGVFVVSIAAIAVYIYYRRKQLRHVHETNTIPPAPKE